MVRIGRYPRRIGEDDETTDPRTFRVIGSGGEHGIGREVICSLPRSVSCRLCRGEHDCPYIVDRPYGRLVVHKRAPVELAVRDILTVATGSADAAGHRAPWRQRVAATVAWAVLVAAVVWNWVVRPVTIGVFLVAGAGLVVTLFGTMIGVPLARWRWRDHGGRRRDGPWRPS